jgi:cystathionine beta-lyase/cystathionine gamma-synthase
MDEIETVSVADPFRSMSEFWRAMNAHSLGHAAGSIWDTYEAGERRQLEARLARLYGAPDAVVVCSGMTAVAASIIGLSLYTGSRIEPLLWGGYFEIAELVDGVLGRLSPLQTGGIPGVRVIEPVANEPHLTVNTRAFGLASAAVVVDNSLFSVSLPWSCWRDRVGGPLCVVESIPKYLERSVSGGVIYGEKEIADEVRQAARRMGVLLNRQACRIILDRDLEAVDGTLAAYAANADRFADALRTARPELIVRRPDDVAAGAGLAGAHSSLVFVIYPAELSCLDEFERWARNVSLRCGGRAVVRAGYGWPQTYGRAYSKDVLNTAAGTEYLRFSIGLEPPELITAIAHELRGVGA